MKKYTFNVDAGVKIMVDLGHVDLSTECFCDASTVLYYGKEEHQFMILSLKDDTDGLRIGMLEVLRGDLQLHESLLGKDLGFLFNQHMYESGQEKNFLDQPKVICFEDDIWVGAKYQMWGGNNSVTVLYNAPDGSIVFEAAPVYPGDFYSDDFNDQEFFEWMKAYKPLFIRKISQETVQGWIKTADQLLRDIAWMDTEGVQAA